ncbi:hypothetical protein QB984_003736 [Salmonella enterica]|nr:hypothetical protein [Salmonella enterica]EKS5919718.1 hypothetical protein [Salmonella enterica]
MLQFFYVIGQIAFLKHLWQPGMHKDLKIYLLLALANSIAHLIAGTASLRITKTLWMVLPNITITLPRFTPWGYLKSTIIGLMTHPV